MSENLMNQRPSGHRPTDPDTNGPTTMRAIVQDRYGSLDVLTRAVIDRPEPGEHEVLLRVRAAGLDRGTRHLMTGQPYLMGVIGFGSAVRRTGCPASTPPARSRRSGRA